MTKHLPHIIYVLSDEHCGRAMSHAGDPNVRTPHMDALAAEGVSFVRARANCPICTPSRGTIFSGRHAHAGPVQFFFDAYKPLAPSTATILRTLGYHTAYFGKWHCGVVRNQVPRSVRERPSEFGAWPSRTPEFHRAGFQDWFAFEVNNAPFAGFYYHQDEVAPRQPKGYQTDWLTELVLDYLRQYRRDQPLFLVLSVEPPHFPLEAPAKFKRFDPAKLVVPPDFRGGAKMRARLATYYAMIENLDWNLGRLRAALATHKRFRDNALTVYFSDHGDFMGCDGLINRKEHPHEESVRIPCLFHWPGVIPAQVSRREKFSLVDMLATTLGLIGAKIPAHNQGVDFSPVLRGKPFSDVEAVLLEMNGSPRWSLDFPDWRGIVTDRWKYAFYETGHELLFDIERDPYEQHNLIRAQPTVRRRLRRQLLELLRRTREPYFDVLIEHGIRPPTTRDIGGNDGSRQVSPAWQDMILTQKLPRRVQRQKTK